jgi:hypothetical protein
MVKEKAMINICTGGFSVYVCGDLAGIMIAGREHLFARHFNSAIPIFPRSKLFKSATNTFCPETIFSGFVCLRRGCGGGRGANWEEDALGYKVIGSLRVGGAGICRAKCKNFFCKGGATFFPLALALWYDLRVAQFSARRKRKAGFRRWRKGTAARTAERTDQR